MKMNVAMASVIKLFKGLSIAGLLQNTASLSSNTYSITVGSGGTGGIGGYGTDNGGCMGNVGTDSTFNNNAIFNAGVKIPTGSGVGKFLKSDAAGNAAWAYANPLGTIVMVSKFVLDNYVDWAGNSVPFASADWKGRGTGIWEGWYFCWGQTWGSYSTPDLRERYPMGYAGTSGTL